MGTQPHLLTVITFLPLLSVAALLLLRAEDHVWMRRIALAASLAEFAVSLLLVRGFDAANPNYQFEEFYPWIGQAIHYHLGVDGISLFLVILTTFLTPAGDSVLVAIHSARREGLLRLAARDRDGLDRLFRLARPFPLFRLLRS